MPVGFLKTARGSEAVPVLMIAARTGAAARAQKSTLRAGSTVLKLVRISWKAAVALGLVLGPGLNVGSQSAAQHQGTGTPGVFDDALGHRVVWEKPPERIVSLSPNLTEILFRIGGGASVIGVTRFCNYPPAANALPRVGGVADPSLEAVAALRPDLVIATRGNPLEFMESLVALHIPVYAVETQGNLERTLDLILEIGAVTGREAGAASLADSLARRLRGLQLRTRDLAAQKRPRVYMGELEGAHWAAGPGSYIHGLIEAAGGRNVGQVAPNPWSPLSLEVIVAGQPEVWLGAYGPQSGGDEETVRAHALEILQTHEGWRRTPLGQQPRMLLIHEDRLQRPGPRIFDVLEELAAFLHPDLVVRPQRGPAR